MLADPGVAAMLLTAAELDERIFATLRAGARGLLLKDTDPAELGPGGRAPCPRRRASVAEPHAAADRRARVGSRPSAPGLSICSTS